MEARIPEEYRICSKANGKGKRDHVTCKVRNLDETARVMAAVQQSQQNQWTSWEAVMQRTLSWNDIWHMAPLRLTFIIHPADDLQLTNVILAKWGK